MAKRRNKYPTAAPGNPRPGVAILGFTDHRAQAPFNDPEFEIWGINELYRYMPIEENGKTLFHRWFEIHARKDIESDADHIKQLGELPFPVYMQQVHDDIKSSTVFPKQEIETYLSVGGLDGKYQTSSISWMIGLAILEGFEKIYVYGVDMAQENEYVEQRPCCEHWLGYAVGKGVEVYLPKQSDLLKSVGQYAFGEEGSQFRLKVVERIQWLKNEHGEHKKAVAELDAQYEKQLAEMNKNKDALDAEYNQRKANILRAMHNLEGAAQDCNFWKRSYSVHASDSADGPHPDRTQDPRTGIKEIDLSKSHEENQPRAAVPMSTKAPQPVGAHQ